MNTSDTFLVKTIIIKIARKVRPWMLAFAALDNVMMSKRKKPAEHTSNAHNSNKEKHENGQARKKEDWGGEKGDSRRTKKDKRYTIPKNKKQLNKIKNSIVKYY